MFLTVLEGLTSWKVPSFLFFSVFGGGRSVLFCYIRGGVYSPLWDPKIATITMVVTNSFFVFSTVHEQHG